MIRGKFSVPQPVKLFQFRVWLFVIVWLMLGIAAGASVFYLRTSIQDKQAKERIIVEAPVAAHRGWVASFTR